MDEEWMLEQDSAAATHWINRTLAVRVIVFNNGQANIQHLAVDEDGVYHAGRFFDYIGELSMVARLHRILREKQT